MRTHLLRASLLVLAGVSAYGALLYEFYRRAWHATLDEARSEAVSVVTTGALLLSTGDLDPLGRPADEGSFEYRHVQSTLQRIREANPNAVHISALRRSAEIAAAVECVVEEDRDPLKPALVNATAHPEMLAGFERPTVDAEVTPSSAGLLLLTAYAPISGAHGGTSAVLAISFDATDLMQKRLRLLLTMLLAFLLVIMLAAATALIYLRKERLYQTNLDLLKGSCLDLSRMVQAEKELTRKNRELEVLNAVSENLSRSFELSPNLHCALDRLLEVAGIDGAIVRLVDMETQELYLAAHRGLSPLLFEGYQRSRIGLSFSGSVAASGEALFVENIPATFGSATASPYDRRIRSYAVVPLRAKERVLGTLALFSLSDPKFPSPCKNLIFSAAQQLAVAVENSTLFEKERNRSAQLALVAEITRRALVTMDIDELLRMAFARIQKEFHFFFIAYYEVDLQQGICIRRAESGGFFEMGYGGLNHRVTLGEGILASACAARRTVYVPDTSADGAAAGSTGNLAKSDLAVPVLIDDCVTGMFELQSTVVSGFSGEDILMVETLADQMAITLKNARLYAEVRPAHEGLRAGARERSA